MENKTDPDLRNDCDCLDIEIDDNGEAVPWWLGVFMVLFLAGLASVGIYFLIQYLKFKG